MRFWARYNKGQGQTLKFHCLRDNSRNIWQNFNKPGNKVKVDGAINLLDFGPDKGKVKGQIQIV